LPFIQFVHEAVYKETLDKLLKAYSQVKAGDPLAEGTLLGPLHTKAGVEAYKKGISKIKEQVELSSRL
jgi:acyl-CoA reductase-like NAD-dependent aldehyde dehydrogenase